MSSSEDDATDEHTPKVILITGGAGFIASHMILHLLKKYPSYTIINLDKLDYCSSTKYFESVHDNERYHFVQGNIQCSDLVSYILETHNVDTIMHFAAESHVDNSFANSLSFTENNVVGTHVLLEQARMHMPRIKRFIHISTDEVYGESAYNDLTLENTLLAPTNPYAATKAAAEHLVGAYVKSFKLPCIISRSNNIYGPHQYPEKLIPKFICRIMGSMSCCIHGDGNTKRSFLYVDDVVDAYDLILHKGSLGSIYNVESGDELSVLDVTRAILRNFDIDEECQADWMEHTDDRAINDLRYHIDGSKLRDLGFTPKWSFEEGLTHTVNWYRNTQLEEIWPHYTSSLGAHPAGK